jgi:hypothetical protein
MSKWLVTVEVDDPEDWSAEGVASLVRMALTESVATEAMSVGHMTIESATEEAYVRVR